MKINGTVAYAGIVFEWEGDYDRYEREFEDFAVMVNGDDIEAESIYIRKYGKAEFERLDEWIMAEALENAEAEAFDASVDAAMDARKERD